MKKWFTCGLSTAEVFQNNPVSSGTVENKEDLEMTQTSFTKLVLEEDY